MFGLRKSIARNAFVLGKVPSHAEFLRTDDSVGAALDAWINDGWQRANALHGTDWEPAFSAGSSYGFLWSPIGKADHVACGVISPSKDAVERAYPVVVACPVPVSLLTPRWASVPIAVEGLLDEADGLARDASTGLIRSDDIAVRLRSLRAPDAGECDAAGGTYGEWCDSMTVESAWSAVSDALGSLEAAASAVDGLRDALSPIVRRERPATGLLLRLPVGQGGALSVALWLDLVQRIGGWKQSVPSLFWAAEGQSVLLTVAPARASTVGELWLPDSRDDGVFDLGQLVDTGRSVPHSLASFMCENPGAPLRDLLSAASA